MDNPHHAPVKQRVSIYIYTRYHHAAPVRTDCSMTSPVGSVFRPPTYCQRLRRRYSPGTKTASSSSSVYTSGVPASVSAAAWCTLFVFGHAEGLLLQTRVTTFARPSAAPRTILRTSMMFRSHADLFSHHAPVLHLWRDIFLLWRSTLS